MPKTYVDNAFNRSAGRVGMPVGSMVISRGSSAGGGGGGGGGGSSYTGGGSGYSYGSSYSGDSGGYGGGSSYSGGGDRSSKYSGGGSSYSRASGGYDDGGSYSRSSKGGSSYSRGAGGYGGSNSYRDGDGGYDDGSSYSSSSKGGRGAGGYGGSSSYSTGYGNSSSASSRSCSSSKKTYVDNSYNRANGRVGLPVGSAVISKSGSSAAYDNSSSSSKKTYVDNSYNRANGRVGLPVGSAVISKSGSSAAYGKSSNSSQKTYVDNSYNRANGRVGLIVGTAVISKSGSAGAYSNGSSSSQKTNVDNSYSPQHGHVDLPIGDTTISKSKSFDVSHDSGIGASPKSGSSTAYDNSSSSSKKTYVDNSYNRANGRVDLPVGSAVISKSGSSAAYDNSSSSSKKTYVDNSYNRANGRVGLPVGSAVISKSGSSAAYGKSSSSSQKTYVDNSYNRANGRVGLIVGTAVISKSGSAGAYSNGSSSSQKTNVDNSYSPQHGYVDLPIGDITISKSKSFDVSHDSGIGASPKVYKDNKLNRSLGRVGDPLGTCVYSRKGQSSKGSKKLCEPQVYVDNSANRSLGRVGMPRGSMPNSRVSKTTKKAKDLQKRIMNEPHGYDFNDDYGEEFSEIEIDLAVSEINRRLEELAWYKRQERRGQRRSKVVTSRAVLDLYTGLRIDFDEIELGRKIGQGGFGDVYFATWNSSVVAVKKLRVQRVSKRRLEDFRREMMTFCDLDHPNIVRFIGACLKTPNLAIVMEYMQTSLFTALHMSEDEVEFTEDERLQILQQTACGLHYLHDNSIAHCDLKSHNILLDYEPGETCVAKITDFGLSMVKSDSESSMSAVEQVRNIGTPRYSAPEVLRGEMLSAKDMMRADIYSFALIMFEVVYEEEPYYNLGYAQLQKQVGRKGVTPEIPESPEVSINIRSLVEECWHYNPRNRPKMGHISSILYDQTELFVEAYTSRYGHGGSSRWW